jgi:CRISPR-associated protein Csd1
LLKLKNHHISKLSAERKGAAVNLEKQIGEIVEKVDDFPRILSLQDQGRFAIGYYHQRQDFFRPSDKDDDSPTTNQ